MKKKATLRWLDAVVTTQDIDTVQDRKRLGPKFRVQQTVPWPMHWMQRSCTDHEHEPDRL